METDITKFTEQSLWEVVSCSACHKIALIVWKTAIHLCVKKRPPYAPTSRHVLAFRTIESFIKILRPPTLVLIIIFRMHWNK